jgi:hypothetical protein
MKVQISEKTYEPLESERKITNKKSEKQRVKKAETGKNEEGAEESGEVGEGR